MKILTFENILFVFIFLGFFIGFKVLSAYNKKLEQLELKLLSLDYPMIEVAEIPKQIEVSKETQNESF